jgi:hypothetical protein
VFDLRRPLDALDAIAGSQRASIVRLTPYLLLLSSDAAS